MPVGALLSVLSENGEKEMNMQHDRSMQHGLSSQHAPDANERLMEQTWSAKVGRFADTWWPLFVIAFGAVFIFGIPTQ